MLPLELHTMHQVGLAWWPPGLQYVFEVEGRLPLTDSPSPLLQGSALSLIGHAEITPAFPRGGLTLRLAPVAVWDLTLRAWGTWYFGTFSSIIPAEDPDWAATAEAKRGLEAIRTGGFGLRLDVDTRLKAKAGPFIAVLEFEARHHSVTAYDGVPDYFWEPTDMLLIPGEGWVFYQHLIFLEEFVPKQGREPYLWAGLYGVRSEAPATGDRNLRAGPLVMARARTGWPEVFAGFTPWIESRFIDPFPGYVFCAVNWSR